MVNEDNGLRGQVLWSSCLLATKQRPANACFPVNPDPLCPPTSRQMYTSGKTNSQERKKRRTSRHNQTIIIPLPARTFSNRRHILSRSRLSPTIIPPLGWHSIPDAWASSLRGSIPIAYMTRSASWMVPSWSLKPVKTLLSCPWPRFCGGPSRLRRHRAGAGVCRRAS